jgi:hypothetical protein
MNVIKKRSTAQEGVILLGSTRRGAPDITDEQLVNAIGEYQKREDQQGSRVASVRVSLEIFVYQDYNEPGWALTVSNYARFPMQPNDLLKFIEGLATFLLHEFSQDRISYTWDFTGETTTLELEKPALEIETPAVPVASSSVSQVEVPPSSSTPETTSIEAPSNSSPEDQRNQAGE